MVVNREAGQVWPNLGSRVPFRMGVFVSFGREGPGDANIQVHLRTTCCFKCFRFPILTMPKD